MTVIIRMFHAISLLGLIALVALVAPGCRRPETPKKKTPEAEAPSTNVAASMTNEESPPPPTPTDDDDVVPDDLVVREIETTPSPDPIKAPETTPELGHPAPVKKTAKKEKVEDDLRTKLLKMRRSVDRRLLWARITLERQLVIEAAQERSAERAAVWEIAKRVPVGAQIESLEPMIQKTAGDAGLTLTDLSYEILPPDVDRLPDSFTGDRPLDLAVEDLVGTVRVSFVLGTEDMGRLSKWYDTLPVMPRFLIVNRIRHTGEAFQILGDAYYIADRKGPVRQEAATDITKELTRVGIVLGADVVRHQDPDHFLLATETSLKEYAKLLEQANEIAAIESAIKRNEVIHEWYESRVKARADRVFDDLLR